MKLLSYVLSNLIQLDMAGQGDLVQSWPHSQLVSDREISFVTFGFVFLLITFI